MGRMAAVLFAAVGIPLHLLLIVNFGTLVADVLQHVSRKTPSLAVALRGNRQQSNKHGTDSAESMELQATKSSPSLPTIIRRPPRTPTESSKYSPKRRTRNPENSSLCSNNYRAEEIDDNQLQAYPVSPRSVRRTSSDDTNIIQTGINNNSVECNPNSRLATATTEINSMNSTPQVRRKTSTGSDIVNVEWPTSSAAKTVLVLPAREDRSDGTVYRNRTRIQLPPIQKAAQQTHTSNTTTVTASTATSNKNGSRSSPSQTRRRNSSSSSTTSKTSTTKETTSEYTGELPTWLQWSPVVAIALYYLLGVLVFGLARGKGPSSCFLFPLDFTTAGGVGNEPGVVRTFYALYLECAVALAISAVSIWRVSATRGLVDLGLKLNLITAGYTS